MEPNFNAVFIISNCIVFRTNIIPHLIRHNHFTLNGKKVTIPSLLVKAGDVIAVKETSKESVKIKALCDGLATAVTPKWLENDAANHLTKVVALPAREDIDFEFNEQLIVELYSK